MEQFTLEKYLADPTRRVVTRGGYNVRIVCTDLQKNDCPIVGRIQYPSGIEEIDTFQTNGRCSERYQSDSDLFFAPAEETRWVYLYRPRYDTQKVFASAAYGTEESARKAMTLDEGFGLTKITWEE